MKKLFLSLLIFLPLSLFAAQERIGDYALYDVSLKEGAQFELRSEVKAYDPLAERYQVTLTYTFADGRVTSRSEWVNAQDLATPAYGQRLLDNCEQIGGQLEVRQIATKDYDTCRVDFSGVISIYGVFPINAQAYSETSQAVVELKEFSWAE